jgi:hypothetical protein
VARNTWIKSVRMLFLLRCTCSGIESLSRSVFASLGWEAIPGGVLPGSLSCRRWARSGGAVRVVGRAGVMLPAVRGRYVGGVVDRFWGRGNAEEVG